MKYYKYYIIIIFIFENYTNFIEIRDALQAQNDDDDVGISFDINQSRDIFKTLKSLIIAYLPFRSKQYLSYCE